MVGPTAESNSNHQENEKALNNTFLEKKDRMPGSLKIEYTLAHRGAEKLWNLLNTEDYVNTLGAMTGNQAMQQIRAGLKHKLNNKRIET